jgi:tripartite-type tricarboxylate transporter receptor subunit TctC
VHRRQTGTARLASRALASPGRPRSIAVLLAATLSLVIATCSPVFATTKPAAKTVKPDLAFFAGKTITWYANPVGSIATTEMQLIAPFVGAYLHATVNVLPIPGNNEININDAAAAAPDGLSLGVVSISADLSGFYTNTNSLTTSLKKLAYVATIGTGPNIVSSCSGSPFSTIQQVLQSKTPVTVPSNPTSAGTGPLYLFLQAYGVPTNYINGYSSPALLTTGCERGDGDIVTTATSSVLNTSNTGYVPNVRGMLLYYAVPRGTSAAFLNSQLSTIGAYMKKHPPKTKAGKQEVPIVNELLAAAASEGIFAPPGTPQPRLLALYNAFKTAFSSPGLQRNLAQLGVPSTITTGAKAASLISYGIAHQSTIVQYLARPTGG